MNIYIGNLSYQTSEDDLRQIFEEYGEVSSVKIIMDRETGRSKGFAFVEMTESGDAKEAIENLHEAEFKGRNMRVNEAEERKERGGRGGFNQRRGGNGGGRSNFNNNSNYNY